MKKGPVLKAPPHDLNMAYYSAPQDNYADESTFLHIDLLDTLKPKQTLV